MKSMLKKGALNHYNKTLLVCNQAARGFSVSMAKDPYDNIP